MIFEKFEKTIWIRFNFEARHKWSNCPIKDVYFLRNNHRHVFHVKMCWVVSHNDRDIEFIDMKKKVVSWVRNNWEYRDLGQKSCESMAEDLLLEFNAQFVSVSEDGENGATIRRV